MGLDDDWIVGRIQWEKFDLFVLPSFLGDALGRVILFHREAPAVFKIPARVELDEHDAAFA